MNPIFAFMALIFSLVSACDKAPVAPRPLAFNDSTTTLADLPAGAEVSGITFGRDGHYVAAVVKEKGGEYMSINGTASAAYDSVRQPIFRTGLAGYAYIAQKAGKECVVVDGREGQWYDAVEKHAFAPDGRIIYAAKRGDKWMIVSGTRESAVFGDISFPLVFSGDGKRVAYVERYPGATKVVMRLCDLELKSCDKGREHDSINELKQDVGLSHLVFAAKNDGKSTVVALDLTQPGVKEIASVAYDAISALAISDNGAHITFLARRGDAVVLVKDGVEYSASPCDTVFEMAVGDGGRTIYTALVKDKVGAFVDGKPTGKEYSSMHFPMVSYDGKGVIYAAERAGKEFLVVNGVEGPGFDKAVGPHLSPDGSCIVYRARQKGERFVVVADITGQPIREHAHYEAVWDPIFSPGGKSVAYGVKDGNKLIWKVEKLDK